MSDWPDTAPLGKSISVLSGFPFPSAQFSEGIGKPLIRIRDLVGSRTETNIVGDFPPAFLIGYDDVLIGMDGDFNVVRWKGPEALLNQRVCKVSSASDELDERFLFWWLKPHIQIVHRRTPQTTVRHLSVGEVYRIPKPALASKAQAFAAAVLDTVDEAIAKTEAVIAKLRQVRAGLLHDLLTRGLDPNGQLRDPIAHPEQFQDSLLGQIPKDWDIRRLEELADIDRGKFAHRPRNEPRFYDGPYPFVQTGDIANAAGEVLTDSSQTLNGAGAAISREFPKNTIAITIAANIADTAILGRSMFLTDSVVGAIVKAPNNVRFIELCIRRAKPKLQARAPQTAQMNINLQDLRPLLVAIPKRLEEQHQISEIYEENARALNSQQINLVKLRRIKFGLMTDLLTGRVRVPETLATTS